MQQLKKKKAFSIRPKATLLLECILDKSILSQESNKYQTRREKWKKKRRTRGEGSQATFFFNRWTRKRLE